MRARPFLLLTVLSFVLSPLRHTYFFFLYLDGDHADLLSFSTRRSSDLPLHGLRHSLLPPGVPARQPHPRLERPGLSGMRLRSEEHTSELQSLRHIVCRLLLEKKNYR